MSSGGTTLRKPILRYVSDYREYRLVVERRSDGYYLLGCDRARNSPLFYGANLSLDGAKAQLIAWVARQAQHEPDGLDWREEHS